MFCEVTDGPYIAFYPIVRFGPLLDAIDLDLQSSETVANVRSLLLARAGQLESSPYGDFSSMSRCRGEYELVDPKDYALDRLQEFWSALATPNYVLLRGVYALMKSDMLTRHEEFYEEALLSLYIALDASFSLIRRELEKEGFSNPAAHDAAIWLHRHFDAPFGFPAPSSNEKYFSEFFEQRVMTVHPASRFGDLPYSPTMHDDVIYLRRSLRQVFAYLVTARHDSGYLEAVRDHAERQGEVE
jgi:hypothetical protein